jgi:cyclic pyranopterin monophosphate synthase
VSQEFTHLDPKGAARMVDVGQKPVSRRTARASGKVKMAPATLERILAGDIPKGDVISSARLAGIMAAKRTDELIPLCHSLPIDAVSLEFRNVQTGILAIEAEVTSTGKTGVEMEALVAVSVASLTIYDMCKSIDRAMQINEIQLEEKTGGVHGDYVRDAGAKGNP